MATFSPPVQPTNSPNYERTFRPVDIADGIRPQGVANNEIMPKGQEIGDRSAEYAGQAAAYGAQAEGTAEKGFGDLFAGIVSTGDFLGKAGVEVVKKDIENRVYAVADRERQAYTETLEQLKAGVGVKSILDASAGKEETPTEISELGETLSTLKGAKDAGKISTTDYRGRLLAEAKNLRAMYPGFKEEIDQQFAKVTGMNPANAYITGLVSDINKAVSSQNSEHQKLLTYIRSNPQYPDAKKHYEEAVRGEFNWPQAIQWAAPFEQEKLNLQRRAAIFQDEQNTLKVRTDGAKTAVDAAAGAVVNRAAATLLSGLGLNSAEDAAKLQEQNKAGAFKAEWWTQRGQEVADVKTRLRVQMLADADTSGATKLIGKVEVVKQVDAALEAFKPIEDRIYNHDFGGIYSSAKRITARLDDHKLRLQTDSKVGPYLTQLETFKNIAGETNVQKFFINSLKSTVPEDLQDWFERWELELRTQANKTITGRVNTFNDMMNEAKTKGINDKEVNKNIVKTVEDIGKPDVSDGEKANLARGAFSPGNRGFISKLNDDSGVYNDKGQRLTGQNAIFQRWTAPEITKNMKRLGESDPQLWQDYKDWSAHTFGSELVSREINNLAIVPPDAKVQVGWDSDNKRLIVQDTRTPEEVRRESQTRGGSGTEGNTYLQRVTRSVNNINNNLYGLKNIIGEEDKSKYAVDTFVLNTIREYGGEAALANMNGIPGQIIRQIGLTKLKPQ